MSEIRYIDASELREKLSLPGEPVTASLTDGIAVDFEIPTSEGEIETTPVGTGPIADKLGFEAEPTDVEAVGRHIGFHIPVSEKTEQEDT